MKRPLSKTLFRGFIYLFFLFYFFLLTSVSQSRSCCCNKDSSTVNPSSVKKSNEKPPTALAGIPDVLPVKPSILRITVAQISPDNVSLKEQKNIQVDYRISILISHPKDFLLQRPLDNTGLILYADGFPLKGMTSDYFSKISHQDAIAIKYWPDSLEIPFIFNRDSTNKEAWNKLFHLAHWNKNKISFNMSLGWDGMFPITLADNNKNGNKVTLLFYSPQTFWILLLFYFLFISYFVYLCHSTGLIRDPDENNKGPYSLSQTQLAFWTVISIGGFIYLILLTGLTDSLNDSILLLLGISGSTTGIASFIDYYKKVQRTTPANQTMAPKKHRTFLLDILSDGVNVSVQRTQIVMWNLVLGIYFIGYVINNKAMPVFSNTLLILAGVSSVLYLGSKGPENFVAANPHIPE